MKNAECTPHWCTLCISMSHYLHFLLRSIGKPPVCVVGIFAPSGRFDDQHLVTSHVNKKKMKSDDWSCIVYIIIISVKACVSSVTTTLTKKIKIKKKIYLIECVP
jgi:hypothetical protein